MILTNELNHIRQSKANEDLETECLHLLINHHLLELCDKNPHYTLLNVLSE